MLGPHVLDFGESKSVTVHVPSTSGHYKGTAALKQSDFGITRSASLGGTAKVKDELKIEFDIVLR